MIARLFLSFNTIMNEISGRVMLLVLITLVVVLIVLLANIKKRNIAQFEAKAAKRKFEENYLELEEAYKQLKATQEQLAQKYEELNCSEEKNKKLAYIDYLTELPNRISFTENLNQELKTIEKDEKIAIIYRSR